MIFLFPESFKIDFFFFFFLDRVNEHVYLVSMRLPKFSSLEKGVNYLEIVHKIC